LNHAIADTCDNAREFLKKARSYVAGTLSMEKLGDLPPGFEKCGLNSDELLEINAALDRKAAEMVRQFRSNRSKSQ
jgi:hypothetical protein